MGAPICVGIDPVYERLPRVIHSRVPEPSRASAHHAVEAISRFGAAVVEAVAPHAACVKIQSACFERYLWPGVEAYHRLIHLARESGLLVIADAKRGDISTSAAHYAAGCLADPPFDDLGPLTGPDAMTVNTYLGDDGIQPFVDEAAQHGKGVFALVRTSNPGGDAVQCLALQDGRTVAQAVGQLIATQGSQPRCVGHSGYSLLGAVVGATKAQDIAPLRAMMPEQIFLVPGFGAQGGSHEGVRACFHDDGTGAVVTASRSVIYAYEEAENDDWQIAIEQAVIEFKRQVVSILRS